jgi:hypothetical protein
VVERREREGGNRSYKRRLPADLRERLNPGVARGVGTRSQPEGGDLKAGSGAPVPASCVSFVPRGPDPRPMDLPPLDATRR